MLKLITSLVIASIFIFSGCTKRNDPSSEEEKVLYALGLSLGNNLAPLNLSENDLKYVKQGMDDKILGKDAKVPLDIYQVKINELFQSRISSRAKAESLIGDDYVNKYLDENPTAKKIESGLIIKILKSSDGIKPKLADTVLIRYKGKLVDGKVFDSTDDRSDAAEIPLSRVIKGWQIGLQQMNVGSKAELVIPPALAYGDVGAPPSIAPGATLTFEVELLGIKGKASGSSSDSESRAQTAPASNETATADTKADPIVKSGNMPEKKK
jgi:FKBP-type peptidyl-prolyl cis-trans isomerase